MEARVDTDVQIVRFTWSMGAKDQSNHPVADSLRSFPQDSWSCTALSGKANDSRNRERVLLHLFSNFKWVRSSGDVGEPLGQVITPRGPLLASRTGDEG